MKHCSTNIKNRNDEARRILKKVQGIEPEKVNYSELMEQVNELFDGVENRDDLNDAEKALVDIAFGNPELAI